MRSCLPARVTCRMEGDVFEMEDQRNWTDASYKTYVRPLALPWPYTLCAGESIAQRVSLSVTGGSGAALSPPSATILLSLRGSGGAAPPLGIGLDPQHATAALAAAGALREVKPNHV